MANVLPILLLGGAALLMMGGKKKVKPTETKPVDEPEIEPEIEPGPSEPDPAPEMHDRTVLCFEETDTPGVFDSIEIEGAILGKEGLWEVEVYNILKPEARKELTGGSWISTDSQQQLFFALGQHVKDNLPLHLIPQGWGLTDEAFQNDAIPVIVKTLLAPCFKISSRTTESGGAPSPEALLMESALKLARAVYIDTGIKTRGDKF
jgi:hypothetical protein